MHSSSLWYLFVQECHMLKVIQQNGSKTGVWITNLFLMIDAFEYHIWIIVKNQMRLSQKKWKKKSINSEIRVTHTYQRQLLLKTVVLYLKLSIIFSSVIVPITMSTWNQDWPRTRLSSGSSKLLFLPSFGILCVTLAGQAYPGEDLAGARRKKLSRDNSS